jgi:hypothetical protein
LQLIALEFHRLGTLSRFGECAFEAFAPVLKAVRVSRRCFETGLMSTRKIRHAVPGRICLLVRRVKSLLFVNKLALELLDLSLQLPCSVK